MWFSAAYRVWYLRNCYKISPICRQNRLCEEAQDCSVQVNASEGQEENNSLSPCYRGQAAVKAVHYWQAFFVAVFNSTPSSELQPPRQHSSWSCWHLPPNQVLDYLVLINWSWCCVKSLSSSTLLPCNKMADVWCEPQSWQNTVFLMTFGGEWKCFKASQC